MWGSHPDKKAVTGTPILTINDNYTFQILETKLLHRCLLFRVPSEDTPAKIVT